MIKGQESDNQTANMYLQKCIEENLMRESIFGKHRRSGKSTQNMMAYTADRYEYTHKEWFLYKTKSQ